MHKAGKIQNILFIGSKSSGLELLKILHVSTSDSNRSLSVITFDDSSDIRTKLEDFKKYTSEKNIPLHIAKNRTDSEKIIKELKPDICFVMGWYWIFTEEILDSVPNGFIGVHYSLLPEYRGFSPLVWSIINGEEIAGFSIFTMNAGMDEGDIWLQKKISIGKDEYIGGIMDKFEKEVVSSFSDLLPKILDGSAKLNPQDHSKATFTAKRTPESGRIDWNKNAVEIYNFIRAQSDPYPGAFTFLNKDNEVKIVIKKAAMSAENFSGTPGQVVKISDEGIYIMCGDKKAIILHDIEVNGEKTKSEKFITSTNIILK